MLVSLCEWMLGEGMLGELSMVNGENSTILLLLNFYADLSSTLSVIRYQLSIINFTIHLSIGLVGLSIMRLLK
jgi:hypothetical protein